MAAGEFETGLGQQDRFEQALVAEAEVRAEVTVEAVESPAVRSRGHRSLEAMEG